MPITFAVNERMGAFRSGKLDALRQRSYTRVFDVTTSDPTAGAKAVMAATGIPQIGTTYSTSGAGAEADAGAFVVGLEARESSDDGKGWDVTVQYGPYNASLFSVNPTSWPSKVTWSAHKYERALFFDKSNNAILNSAGDPFGEPVTVDDSRTVMTVVRNELASTFSMTLAESYRDTINTGIWNGYAAKTVKCSSITTGELQYDSNAQVWYYTVTYIFEINRDTWVKKVLDHGYAELDSTTSKRKAIKGADGKEVSEPVPLDGSGHQLATGGTPVTLSFDVYSDVDFSVFNIDLSARLGAV